MFGEGEEARKGYEQEKEQPIPGNQLHKKSGEQAPQCSSHGSCSPEKSDSYIPHLARRERYCE